MALGANKITGQQYQHTHKRQPDGHQSLDLSRSPQCPFTVTHERLAPAVGKGFYAAPGPTDTSVPQVAPGADQISFQQDQRTYKFQPRGYHPPGIPRAPQGSFPVSHERLAPAVGKGFHTAPGPTDKSVTQVAPGADQSPCQQDQRTHKG